MVFGMARPISLSVIGDDADNVPITIPIGEIVIGREPDEGVELPFHSISREHGMLANFGGQWFFQDLESTNGSWVNGLEAVPREWSILRHHDYLQLADRVFRVHFDGDEQSRDATGMHALHTTGRSLFVFRDGIFEREIPMPQEGEQLKVGGDGGDVPLRADISSSPGLVINQRQESLVAYSVELGHKTALNRDVLLRTTELYDRDVLHIGEYLIIVHDPPVLDRNGIGAGFSAGSGGTRTDLREWIESEHRNQPEGQIIEAVQQEQYIEDEEGESVGHKEAVVNERATMMFSEGEVPFSLSEWESAHKDGEIAFSRRPTLVGQFGRLREEADEDGHPNSVHSSHSYDSKDVATHSGERLIVFVSILLFLLLFVLVAWWLFLS